jgi:hypothetical protein
MKTLVSLAVLWVVSMCPSAGYAQNAKHQPLTIKVPFEFVVGNQTFPAGTYYFRSLLNSVPGKAEIDVLEVRAAEGGLYAAIVTDAVSNSEPSHPKLVFARSGGRTFLSEVWETGKPAVCRVQQTGMQMAAAGATDKVTLIASADWR